jgi:hypothetical protein
MVGASTKISSASVVTILRSFARSTIVKQLFFSSLIYLLLMRRQTWALKSRLRAAGGDALANEITHSLCGAKDNPWRSSLVEPMTSKSKRKSDSASGLSTVT